MRECHLLLANWLTNQVCLSGFMLSFFGHEMANSAQVVGTKFTKKRFKKLLTSANERLILNSLKSHYEANPVFNFDPTETGSLATKGSFTTSQFAIKSW